MTAMESTGRATRLDFPVKGMHCAACVNKVERALRTVPGVQRAVVNLATERATVELADERPAIEALRDAVAAVGYTVPAEIGTSPETEDRERVRRREEDRILRSKFIVGAILSVASDRERI